MPDHVIAVGVFDALDEYVTELEAGTAIVDDVVPETSPMLAFVENAFAQFFQNQVGREIKGFNERASRHAARLRASNRGLTPQDRSLIVLYQQFCKRYEDVQNASYGGHAEVLEDFHTHLVARLIKRIGALAEAIGDDDLRDRAEEAFDDFSPAADAYDWQQHSKEGDDDDDDE